MAASIKEGIAWIAWNDEPEDRDIENISGYISTKLLADLFHKDSEYVATKVANYREKHNI